jgi:hypothetical protein
MEISRSRSAEVKSPWSALASVMAACALASGAVAQAPQADAPPELVPAAEAQQRIDAAKANLRLKPEQQSQVRGLLEDGANRMRAIQAKYVGDDSAAARGAKLRELRAVQHDFRGQLSTILTPEQMLHWDLMRDEVRQYAREHLKEKAALEEF